MVIMKINGIGIGIQNSVKKRKGQGRTGQGRAGQGRAGNNYWFYFCFVMFCFIPFCIHFIEPEYYIIPYNYYPKLT